MDLGVMNDTRKIVTKIKQQRDDLKQKDGKTKDRVEGWRKNIHALTNDLKHQVNLLDDIGSGESNTEGGGDMRKDFFSNLVHKLNKDIEDLVKICQRVTTLNLKKKSDDNEKNWIIKKNEIRNEAIKVLGQSQDQCKLLLFENLRLYIYSN